MRASLGLAVSNVLLVGIAACGGVPDPDGSLDWDEGSADIETPWRMDGDALALAAEDHPPVDEPIGTAASAATLASRAFVLTEQASLNHTATGSNSYNSRGGSNSIVRNSVGTYVVTFGNIFSYWGSPHVVSYGSGNARCQLLTLTGATGSTPLSLHVHCYNPAGAKVDSRFVAFYDDSFSNGTTGGNNGNAYAVNANPSASNASPYVVTWNPAAPFDVYTARWGVGLYIVTFPGLNSIQGTFNVTPLGPNPRTCQIQYWGPSGTDTVVALSCHRPGGDKGDSMFTIRYMDRQGAENWDRENGFAWMSDTTTSSYSPHSSYSWNTAADSNLVNIAGNASTYQWIEFPSFPTTTTNRKLTGLVTAYAGAGAQIECHPRSWTSKKMNITCTNAAGTTVKSWHTAWFTNQEL